MFVPAGMNNGNYARKMPRMSLLSSSRASRFLVSTMRFITFFEISKQCLKRSFCLLGSNFNNRTIGSGDIRINALYTSEDRAGYKEASVLLKRLEIDFETLKSRYHSQEAVQSFTKFGRSKIAVYRVEIVVE
jgi:hypothetical protein